MTGKDPRLVAVMERLREALGSDYFVPVDHWDGDRLAIGLAKPDVPGVLVYVAVALDSDDLFFECEVPAAELYEVTSSQGRAGHGDVLGAVARHLGV